MKTKVFVFCIVIIAGALRIYNLEQKNLWFDEVYSWKVAQGSVTEIISETSGDIHPPFYYIVLKYWMNLFSDSIFSMRMLSVMLSLAAMFFIYRISRMLLKNDLRVILVLLLYAVSPLNIYYSQEVRMLNLNLFLCLGSVYYFLKFAGDPAFRHGIAYLLFTIFAVYTHYFAFLIFFTEIILIFIFYFFQKINKVTLKKYIIYVLLINIFYIPWYPVFFSQVSKGQPWRTRQSVSQVADNVMNYFKDIFLSSYFNSESSGVKYFAVFISLFIIAFILFSLFKIMNSKTFFSDRVNAFTLFFFIPLIAASVVSLNQSIILSRYLSILLPYLFITLVYFSFNIYKTKIAVLLNIFLIAVCCYGAYIYFNSDFKNNDYRKIISYLEKNYNDGDEIIVEPHFMGWTLNYYLKHSNSGIAKPSVLGWDLDMQLDSLKKSGDNKNVWFILDYSSLEKNHYDSLSYIMKMIGYDKSSFKSFYVMPSKVNVWYFKKPTD